jgi:hypothetical protein
MAALYQDAMTIVRHVGKPNLFITFTCNPKWPEIQNALLPGQTAQDRPDIVACVFRLKLAELFKDIREREIFGTVVGRVHTIEFQKRGLPHAHMLFILAPDSRPQTIDDYDAIVSAELPDPLLHPQLYDTVTTCMMHGPCGAGFPNAPCMKDGKCSKRYPHHFSETTTADEDS